MLPHTQANADPQGSRAAPADMTEPRAVIVPINDARRRSRQKQVRFERMRFGLDETWLDAQAAQNNPKEVSPTAGAA